MGVSESMSGTSRSYQSSQQSSHEGQSSNDRPKTLSFADMLSRLTATSQLRLTILHHKVFSVVHKTATLDENDKRALEGEFQALVEEIGI